MAGTYSGIETYYEEVGSRLAERGHTVTAYCRKHFTPAVDTFRGITVRRLPSLRTKHLETISHSLLSTLHCMFVNYDIVQFHAIGSAPLALLPRLRGTTTVVSVRGLDWQRAKWNRFARGVLRLGELASAKCPTATAVVSETLGEHYRKEHGKAARVISNPIPTKPETNGEILEELGLEAGRYILFSGRISPEKQVHTLIEAALPLLGDMKLAVAGGTSYSDDYVTQVREQAREGQPDGSENVVFLGQVPHDTVNELLEHCHAFVLPSTMEGLSIALLEAVAFGSCIVASDIPENREVLGHCGLTFPVGDVERLREHLAALISEPELAEVQRRLTRERASELPGWDEVAELTEDFYYDILN